VGALNAREPAAEPVPVGRLAAVRDLLSTGAALDLPDRRLAATACERVLARRDRREAAALRRAGLRSRDELIRRAATGFYTGSTRARATALLQDARRYAATGWRVDRGRVTCPGSICGTARELLWQAMKAHKTFPSSISMIEKILARKD
jgi:hypothetical protein